VISIQPHERAALDRLFAAAAQYSGQSARVRQFLFAWHNADELGGFDLWHLRNVDDVIARDMLTVIGLICRVSAYPPEVGYGDEISALIRGFHHDEPRVLNHAAGELRTAGVVSVALTTHARDVVLSMADGSVFEGETLFDAWAVLPGLCERCGRSRAYYRMGDARPAARCPTCEAGELAQARALAVGDAVRLTRELDRAGE
jgi:predicted Zn-ribbon and HTH transcriptional regulator